MFRLLLENVWIALQSIFSNKTRGFLTALGIVIGILAVTLMGTLISGLDGSFERSMSFLGKDILYISKHEWFGDQDWWETRGRPDIKPEYVEKLKLYSDKVLAAAPSVSRGFEVSRGKENTLRCEVMGTTPEYMQTSSITIEKGRFFTPGEERSGIRSVVIGYDIAENLFGKDDPIGEKLRVGNIDFRVIGLIAKQGKFLGLFSMDNRVIVPFATYQRLFSRRGWLQISVKVPEESISESREEIRGVMRRIRGLRPAEDDDFAVNQQEAFQKQYNSIKYAIGGTGIFITVLSLVVGGIGIMNIMFVSVKERTREIGVRKAIGANKTAILTQFLLEAIFICMLGGLTGIGLAFGISLLIGQFFPSTMPVGLALGALFLSMSIGVISGLVPSYQAAKMDPIEALRYE